MLSNQAPDEVSTARPLALQDVWCMIVFTQGDQWWMTDLLERYDSKALVLLAHWKN